MKSLKNLKKLSVAVMLVFTLSILFSPFLASGSFASDEGVKSIIGIDGNITVTDSDGNIMDMDSINIKSRNDIYINGKVSTSIEDGVYWIQVTSKEGEILGKSRGAIVEIKEGEIVESLKLTEIVYSKASDYEEQGFDLNTNEEVEYIIWLNETSDFNEDTSIKEIIKINESIIVETQEKESKEEGYKIKLYVDNFIVNEDGTYTVHLGYDNLTGGKLKIKKDYFSETILSENVPDLLLENRRRNAITLKFKGEDLIWGFTMENGLDIVATIGIDGSIETQYVKLDNMAKDESTNEQEDNESTKEETTREEQPQMDELPQTGGKSSVPFYFIGGAVVVTGIMMRKLL